jgi:Zn-dependent peptidase ImmA (M78 family)/transcriptional regulator with XRE-family HTH domain
VIRAEVKPELLRWARERAGMTVEDLGNRFPKFELWERGQARPTLKQLEGLAKATSTPVGYLFLPEPPVERIPIPDFRRIAGQPAARPSPNLLEMLYVCQQRQAWYHDYAKAAGEQPRPFVGSVRRSLSIEQVAERMRHELRFDLDARRECATWTEALRHFIAQSDAVGVLVMCSGVVLNNNRRRLDPDEFRGFAMADDLAPLVFINGADSKAAQMFTLAHELAHIWLGQSAVSDADAFAVPDQQVESWCNRVAAEMLVPLQVLRDELRRDEKLPTEVAKLARRFKVSTLVILRRIRDVGALSNADFSEAYEAELKRIRDLPKGSGGDFYLTQAARVSKRFARALVASTLEGQTLYRDALQMLGISKVETFHELGRNLEFRI